MLSQSLRELQRDNLVLKQEGHYILSESGQEAKNILIALCNWSGKVYFS